MAATKTAHTEWLGNLQDGKGQVAFDSSGIGEFPVSWASRSGDSNGVTSPEELVAAAHSTCFSMALSNGLTKAGTPPTRLETRADVTFVPGTGVTGSHITVKGEVPGLSDEEFAAAAEDAKLNCPISQALSIPITLTVSSS